ncbi:MAG TPA: alpha/beta fold hydrolase [Pyrinomonadaceae bacterium]|nr:alpha/beta fold hydrolase [Pyrinomonadaceae bacterium]
METLREETASKRVAGGISNEAAHASLDTIKSELLAKPFKPHPLFKSGHAQTLVAYAWPRRRTSHALRSDEARLFEVEPEVRLLVRCRWHADRRAHPTLLLVHGLEGSSESIYMLSTALKAHRAGFNVLRLNIRTCGDTLHLTETLYNSGMSQDLRAVISELVERDHLTDIFLGGVSLGGNMSLKLAGEYGAEFPRALKGACAVSPSVELAASAARIEQRGNWIYQRKFIRSLKRRMREAARLYPERYDTSQLRHVRTLREFDERYTAPHGGFRNADDYYARSSALPLIASIRIPTLIIHAQDDPFIPFDSLRHPSVGANPNIILLAPEHGGHVGFVGDGETPGEDRFWAENRLVEFCAQMMKQGMKDEG